MVILLVMILSCSLDLLLCYWTLDHRSYHLHVAMVSSIIGPSSYATGRYGYHVVPLAMLLVGMVTMWSL